MSDEIVKLAEEFLDINENIYGVAIINADDGKIIHQTENWDVQPDANSFLEAWKNSKSSIVILTNKYMIVENTPERLVATNVSGKGHLIGASAGKAKVLCYINPAIGPRDALNEIQLQANKVGSAL
ncbi:MAG: hypothetical protein ACFFCS_18020 [Candidatus Hodarchaeota archaeon]